MKIAVLGAKGFVGSAICRELDAIAITRDNYPDFVSESFDVLINADGNSSKWQANDCPVYDFETNVKSVYDSIFDFYFHKYIYISSYDAHKDNSYGLHKKLAEVIIKHYTDFIILRCPIIIGKNAKKGFLYDALHDIPLYVDKDSEYQVITNTEIAKIIKVLIDKKIANKGFYVGSTDSIRVGDLSVLLDRKIEYRDDANYENYVWDVSEMSSLYHIKTAEEYIKDVV
jgi:dTDP-4-dehydrorhamnose reductase